MASLATKSSVSLLFALLFFSSFCFFEARGFDYFMLALQRPDTFCQGTTACCSSNKCCQTDSGLTEFTIHGLWTGYDNGSYPSCCTGPSFDMNEILPMQEVLQKYWPTLSCSLITTCNGDKEVFWAYQWVNYGTCSAPVIEDQYSYFLTTLNVYFKYNVTHILNEAGYVPSDSDKYPLGGIASAIKEYVGVSPQLACSGGALEEVRLCFYKDFKPRDCAISYSSCPPSVTLPTYTPSSGFKKVKPAISMVTRE